MSRIIFLNGTSSSGKSSVAKAIQYLSEEPWLLTGVDSFISMLPTKYTGFGEKSDQGFSFFSETNEHGPTIEIKTGVFGGKFFNTCIKMIKVLADDNYNLIIDEIMLKQSSLEDYFDKLNRHDIYFVRVNCELRFAQEREVLRGDRAIGLANSQFKIVHEHEYKYDLEIDTVKNSPFECASNILDFIQAK